MNTTRSLDYASFFFRLATPADAEKVRSHRVDAYQKSTHFQLLDEKVMGWNQTDTTHLVLLIVDADGEIIASVRGVTLRDPEEFIKVTNIAPTDRVLFPAFHIKTSCTTPKYVGYGMNRLLKNELFSLIKGGEIKCIASTLPRYSWRANDLEKTGFKGVPVELEGPSSGAFAFNCSLNEYVIPMAKIDDYINGLPDNLISPWQLIHRAPETRARAKSYLKKIIL